MCMIRLKNLILTLLLTLPLSLLAQTTFTVKGRVMDGDTALSLEKATVTISPMADTSRKRTFTAAANGSFEITGLRPGTYLLQVSFTGYDLAKQNVSITTADKDLGDVLLFKKMNESLTNVVVTGKVPPARQVGDTTEINAAALKVNPDATVEDMLKKAPGVVIQNGRITAQGEEVKRVTIDGREFFGDDATAAIRNLPAQMVDRFQVFDQQSDQARLTGVSDGNEQKAINIVTKANMRKGQFGRLYAGYGTDDRYAAGASMNYFNNTRRINFIGLFNNVNQQNFSGEDLLGVSGAANPNRRWGRGGGNDFSADQQAGIAKTNAVGLNYSDVFLQKKLEVTGSYFFNNADVNARSETNRQQFLPGDSSQFYSEVNTSRSQNWNHRLNGRIEYKIDSSNTLILSPRLSFQKNESLRLLDGENTGSLKNLISRTVNRNEQNGDAFNFRNELTYRHSFAKRGRSISLNLNTSWSDRESETYLDAISAYERSGSFLGDTLRQLTDNATISNNYSANLAYTEPIGKKGSLQLNYNPQWSTSSSDQRNFQFDKTANDYTKLDTTLSNVFDNRTKAQNGGVQYRLGDRDNEFSIGVNYQHTKLESDLLFPEIGAINKTFSNFLPNLGFRKSFSKKDNIRLFYRASVQLPNVNQLQNVINISNPLFFRTGNPDLDQSYQHFVGGRYSYTDAPSGKNFFVGVFSRLNSDYVTNATWIASKDSVLGTDIILRRGSQISKPINLDGFVSLRSYLNYGMPLKFIKSNLNLSSGVTYERLPGQVNNVNNFTNSYAYNLGVNIGSNISEFIDFNLNYNGNFNNVTNSVNPALNNRYYSHSAGVKVNLLTKNGWFLLNDVANTVYSGLADGFNQDFWLWNVSTGKKFLKDQRGELKLSVFDLLKQNQSVVRNVGESFIEDVQTVVLQQYFMLTFTYTLRNFGKGSPPPSNEQSPNFRR